MKAKVEVAARGIVRLSFPESVTYARVGDLLSEADINDLIVQLRGARTELASMEIREYGL